MNHGSLGFIEDSGIYLPLDVINLLSIGKDGCLFGLFYPSPKGLKGYENVTQKLDFMLTPIEPRLWSRSARVVIHLAQKPGSLRKIIEYLTSENISVIHAEGSRSAHRYATWSLHIAFEDISLSLEYDFDEQVYKPILEKIERLRKGLFEHCKKALFHQRSNSNSLIPVEIWPNTALSYFHNFVQEQRSISDNSIYEPFELNLSTEGFFATEKMKIKSILVDYLDDINMNLLPSIIFAEFDNKFLNIRLALIPEPNLNRFFEIGVTYHRLGNSEPCVGIIAAILNCFPKEYNIWHSYNFTKSQSKSHKQGKLLFLVEDCSKGSLDFVKKAKSRLSEIEGYIINKRIIISSPKVIPLSRKRVKKLMEDSQKHVIDYKYDVFLSYCERDVELAIQLNKILVENKISSYMAKEKIHGGDKFSEKILEDLISSREVCVLCTDNSMNSKWVHTECGAALALKKTIIPVLYNFTHSDLPDYLRGFHFIAYEEFKQKYVIELENRKEEFEIDRFMNEFIDHNYSSQNLKSSL